MNNNNDRKMTLFFYLTILFLLLYTLPLYIAFLSYLLTEKFTQGYSFLYYTFVPFLGERHSLLDKLTRLLAPLVAAFSAVAFVGPRNTKRAIIIIIMMILLLICSFIDISVLTEEKNLASLNAYEVSREITSPGVYITLERYQDTLFALIAMVLGISLTVKPEGEGDRECPKKGITTLED